jgi:RND family efflux transporter MFP subunit
VTNLSELFTNYPNSYPKTVNLLNKKRIDGGINMLMSHRAPAKVAFLMVFLLAAAFPAACSPTNQPSSSSQEVTPTPIPTAIEASNPTFTVQKGEVVSKLQFTGRVAPITQKDLFFKADGRVRNVFFERNAKVKAGDVIADLEIAAMERQLELTEMDIQTNQIYVDMAKIRLDYAEKDYPSRDQKQNVALLKEELAIAELNLKRASLNVADLRKNIEDAQIIAPFDGDLLSVTITKGDAITGYKPVVQLADLTKLEIASELQGSDQTQIAEGMTVSMFFISRPGDTFSGLVRQMPSSLGQSANSNVEVVDKVTHISVDDPTAISVNELGDLVRVTVILEKRDNVLWLPPQAIRNFEGRRFVLVQDGEAQKRVDVKLGLKGEDRVEIMEGLQEGQTVVAP